MTFRYSTPSPAGPPRGGSVSLSRGSTPGVTRADSSQFVMRQSSFQATPRQISCQSTGQQGLRFTAEKVTRMTSQPTASRGASITVPVMTRRPSVDASSTFRMTSPTASRGANITIPVTSSKPSDSPEVRTAASVASRLEEMDTLQAQVAAMTAKIEATLYPQATGSSAVPIMTRRPSVSPDVSTAVRMTSQPTASRAANMTVPVTASKGSASPEVSTAANITSRSDDMDPLQTQVAAMQAKIEAAEKRAKETKSQLQAVEEEANAAKAALAEAQAARAKALDMVLAARASHRPSPAQSQATLPPAMPLNGKQLIGRPSMEDLEHHWDVVVVGGGPVGVAAAMKAAVLGHRCIIVDKPKVAPMPPNGLDVSFGGPTGLWSKALRDVGKHVDVPSLQSMHLDDDVIWHQIRNMCLRLASSNASHQVKTLEKFKISYVQASATVVSPKNVLVDQKNGLEPVILQTDYVLVATGSKPMRPSEIPFDDFRICDSDTINSLTFLPKSVAVLGSGIIAIEYAKIFRKLGCKVYMLVRSSCMSALERIGLDHDIAQKLIEVLQTDDVVIFENTVVSEWDVPARREDGPLTLKLKSKDASVPKQVEVDVFLAATGRVPNVSGWGAEKLGIKLAKRGHVEVDERYETSVRDIYAVGDVIGPPSLASTGVYQAQAAMLEMFGQGHMNKFDSFPVGMWTVPECGYYGITSAEASKKGIEVKEGLVQYDACLRGRVFAPVGLLKLVFRVTDGVILGVHILGDDACEMVHYGMDLVKQEVSIFQVMTTCFTAVTFHELFKEAALHGNSQLEFGLEWHKILDDIGVHMDNHEHGMDMERMEILFRETDTDNDGRLDCKEIHALFHKYGCAISRATASNLVRLSSADGEYFVSWEKFENIFDIIDEVRANSHFGGKENKAEAEEAQIPVDRPRRKSMSEFKRLSVFAPPVAGA